MNSVAQFQHTWATVVSAFHSCSPVPLDELHPAALRFLCLWFRGMLDDIGFMIRFGLPDSDLIPVASCLVESLRGWAI